MSTMQNNRLKLFLDNFIIYGLGGMMSRLIPMLMLPVITRLYPNSEYIGLNDLNQTFISFAQALAVCGMYDAMFRVFFEYKQNEDQRRVCSTVLFFVMTTSLIGFALCIIFRFKIAYLYFGNEKYHQLVLITALGFLLSATNQIMSAPTRMQNKRRVFLITNTVAPMISYAICIPLILKGYYLFAMPIGTIISAFIIELAFARMNYPFFSIRCFDLTMLKELARIGLPLMPNFLVYWIYNSADKIMISHILGNAYTGIYSVSAKMGHVSNLIYNAFSGGWLYFAYSTMNDSDQVQLKSNIFEYLSAVSVFFTILIMGLSRLGFTMLFPEEYISGYLTMPYLFIAPLLLMLYQVIANQFSIIKKTYYNLLALSAGAAMNIILNYVLIRLVGNEGASIATVTGYSLSLTICIVILTRMKLITINSGARVNFVTLLIYFLLWRFCFNRHVILSVSTSILVSATVGFRYKREVHGIIEKLHN